LFRSAVLLGTILAQMTSPNDAYRAALSTMRALPVPAYVTYRTDLDAGDATIVLSQLSDGRVKPRIVMGAGLYDRSSWQVDYRADDGLAAIATEPDKRALTSMALFDPTWNGVSLWLRRGLLATLERETATPAPNATPDKEPATIATVYAFDPNAYRVEDAGVAWCGNDPGRLLRLTALRDVAKHPLQRVVIDVVDDRICTVRFAVSGTEGEARFDGYVELQFAHQAGYYLISGGYLDVAARENGDRIGWAHVRFHYRDAQAPASLPAEAFATK
jgi:hypothetical protein